MGSIKNVKGEGLPVRKLIDSELSLLVSYIDYMIYDENNISDYKDSFNSLIQEKTFYNCKFNDNKWYFKDIEENSRKFTFDYEYNHKINNELKAFVVIMVHDKRFNPNNVSAMVGLIKKIILITNNFSEKNLYDFQKEIDNTPIHQRIVFKTALKYYMAFIPNDNIESYWIILQQLKITEDRNARELPPYNLSLIHI